MSSNRLTVESEAHLPDVVQVAVRRCLLREPLLLRVEHHMQVELLLEQRQPVVAVRHHRSGGAQPRQVQHVREELPVSAGQREHLALLCRGAAVRRQCGRGRRQAPARVAVDRAAPLRVPGVHAEVRGQRLRRWRGGEDADDAVDHAEGAVALGEVYVRVRVEQSARYRSLSVTLQVRWPFSAARHMAGLATA